MIDIVTRGIYEANRRSQLKRRKAVQRHARVQHQRPTKTFIKICRLSASCDPVKHLSSRRRQRFLLLLLLILLLLLLLILLLLLLIWPFRRCWRRAAPSS